MSYAAFSLLDWGNYSILVGLRVGTPISHDLSGILGNGISRTNRAITFPSGHRNLPDTKDTLSDNTDLSACARTAAGVQDIT